MLAIGKVGSNQKGSAEGQAPLPVLKGKGVKGIRRGYQDAHGQHHAPRHESSRQKTETQESPSPRRLGHDTAGLDRPLPVDDELFYSRIAAESVLQFVG